MAEHDQNAAVEDRLGSAEYPVSEPAADNAGHIDKGAVDGHDRKRGIVIQPEPAFGNLVIHIINKNLPSSRNKRNAPRTP